MSDIDVDGNLGHPQIEIKEESKCLDPGEIVNNGSRAENHSILDQMIGIGGEEADFNIEDKELAEAIEDYDDFQDAPKQEKIEIKREIDVEGDTFGQQRIENNKRTAEGLAKLKQEFAGRMDPQAKIKMERYKLKREMEIQKRWDQALALLGVEPDLIKNNKEKMLKIYPFCDFNFSKAKKGEYQKTKMGHIAMELLKFEVINDTYNVECKVRDNFIFRISQERRCKGSSI
jgi:sRNA-binding protein